MSPGLAYYRAYLFGFSFQKCHWSAATCCRRNFSGSDTRAFLPIRSLTRLGHSAIHIHLPKSGTETISNSSYRNPVNRAITSK
jgi:hypothetical protein